MTHNVGTVLGEDMRIQKEFRHHDIMEFRHHDVLEYVHTMCTVGLRVPLLNFFYGSDS